jgi:hypothetical protein
MRCAVRIERHLTFRSRDRVPLNIIVTLGLPVNFGYICRGRGSRKSSPRCQTVSTREYRQTVKLRDDVPFVPGYDTSWHSHRGSPACFIKEFVWTLERLTWITATVLFSNTPNFLRPAFLYASRSRALREVPRIPNRSRYPTRNGGTDRVNFHLHIVDVSH